MDKTLKDSDNFEDLKSESIKLDADLRKSETLEENYDQVIREVEKEVLSSF